MQTGRWKRESSALIERVVSGGQTGVDRAALDAALSLGLNCGGWCPRGRRAEDGAIPDFYPLKETPDRDYIQRTEWNVRDSDTTLVLCCGKPLGGTAMTVQFAKAAGKPVYLVDLEAVVDEQGIRRWLDEQRVVILNIAGSRESQHPGIYRQAFTLLLNLLAV
ncbi:MAG: putative molybdenum carrier protein [Zetaproteobacteria bacterium]|nr:MAG: putative molybdenum carrier protein [Zetaproteobacteria bacterium]